MIVLDRLVRSQWSILANWANLLFRSTRTHALRKDRSWSIYGLHPIDACRRHIGYPRLLFASLVSHSIKGPKGTDVCNSTSATCLLSSMLRSACFRSNLLLVCPVRGGGSSFAPTSSVPSNSAKWWWWVCSRKSWRTMHLCISWNSVHPLNVCTPWLCI